MAEVLSSNLSEPTVFRETDVFSDFFSGVTTPKRANKSNNFAHPPLDNPTAPKAGCLVPRFFCQKIAPTAPARFIHILSIPFCFSNTNAVRTPNAVLASKPVLRPGPRMKRNETTRKDIQTDIGVILRNDTLAR